MKKTITRRQAFQNAASVTASAMLSGVAGLSQQTEIRIAGRAVEVALTAAGPETVRITAQPLENGHPQPLPSDGALVKEDWGKPVIAVRNLATPRTVKCGDLVVKLSNSPLTIRVETQAGRLVQELKCDAAGPEISFRVGDAPVFGLGQGGPQFDRRGSVDRMRSGQGGYQLRTHGAKVPIQFAISASGWSMFVHHPLGAFDLTGKEGRVQPADAGDSLPLDIFVIAADRPNDVMAAYAMITGYPEMPPLWSLGYQQSHRTLGPPEEILEEAKIFREKKMPCEAMIYLGTDFCPNGWNTHNGEFSWNTNAFPDAPRAIQQLHEDKFRVVLHIVVEGRRFSGKVSDPCTAPPLPAGRTSDNHWPEDRQVSCYWPAHKPLFDLGVDGWWPDQGDGYDAASRLARNRMYFEGAQMYRPNQRVYALHRNGYAGMQRYASFLWSGDVQSTWETLKTHIAVAINTGLSGIPYWGTDIGGFVPTQEYTGELFARWFQFAAFNPLFRSQMMPYLYSAVKETCETGMPVIRALWLHYPDDPASIGRADEYLYGRDILVAPVVDKSANSRSLYLPRGQWYDFWTHERVEGGREILRAVNLETIPLYLRAGSIFPMGPIRQHVEEKSEDPLTLWLHPGSNGAFSLYEDDGETFNYRRGEFMRMELAWNDAQRRLRLRLAPGSRMMGAARRNIVVQVRGESARKELVFEGKPLDVRL